MWVSTKLFSPDTGIYVGVKFLPSGKWEVSVFDAKGKHHQAVLTTEFDAVEYYNTNLKGREIKLKKHGKARENNGSKGLSTGLVVHQWKRTLPNGGKVQGKSIVVRVHAIGKIKSLTRAYERIPQARKMPTRTRKEAELDCERWRDHEILLATALVAGKLD
jgi:hypothetical protein